MIVIRPELLGQNVLVLNSCAVQMKKTREVSADLSPIPPDSDWAKLTMYVVAIT